MKITKVIENLQAILESEGDLETFVDWGTLNTHNYDLEFCMPCQRPPEWVDEEGLPRGYPEDNKRLEIV
jgi:hypothetical protein